MQRGRPSAAARVGARLAGSRAASPRRGIRRPVARGSRARITRSAGTGNAARESPAGPRRGRARRPSRRGRAFRRRENASLRHRKGWGARRSRGLRRACGFRRGARRGHTMPRARLMATTGTRTDGAKPAAGRGRGTMSDTEKAPPLLIVEDDASALRQLRWTFDGYAVATAGDRTQALAELRRTQPAVVLLDLGLPPDAEGASEGLAALPEILRVAPETKVIVVTGREERAHALRAIELGAHDFYQKPVNADEIRLLVERAFRLHRLEEENRRLARAARGEPLPGIVCVSEAMRRVCRLVERAAASEISVLLFGESGTGKEVLARALHGLSHRASGPFVAINCAAIPEQLLESELFGHERGAFTGADRRVVGRLELAHEGTLFLDEIGDMPAGVQAKLLRFLQERVIQRVGGREEIRLDTRVVSATHRDVRERGEEAPLREDLYFRLSELLVEVPPLRERPDDAVVLAQHFFELFREGRALQGLAPDAVAAIASHTWPGNVRELENRMKRAVVLAEGSRVTARDLDFAASEAPDAPTPRLADAVREAERRVLTRAWAEAGGNVSLASKLLGVSRPTLYKLLKDHGFRE